MPRASAMAEFSDFIGFIDTQLRTRNIERLETMSMPANFSSIVGEFMTSAIPNYCATIVKNAYHNGHPDLIPAGRYPGNKLQHGTEGIEVKGSRYMKSWQGHNAEDAWLMVFCFASGRPTDRDKGIPPAPFRFIQTPASEGSRPAACARSARARQASPAGWSRCGRGRRASRSGPRRWGRP